MTYRLTAFNGDDRCRFLFQRPMQFRHFDYLQYVLFSVLYMGKTQIKQSK